MFQGVYLLQPLYVELLKNTTNLYINNLERVYLVGI